MMASLASKIVKEISGQSAIISIPRLFIQLTGDLASAAVLSQLVYWQGKREGAFYKTDSELETELLISSKQLSRIRPRLREFGVSYKRKGLPAKMHYQVDLDALTAALENLLLPLGETDSFDHSQLLPKGGTVHPQREEQVTDQREELYYIHQDSNQDSNQEEKHMSAAIAAVSIEKLEKPEKKKNGEVKKDNSTFSGTSLAIAEDLEKITNEQLEIYSEPTPRDWFYAMWNERKPERSAGLESNREVDKTINAHVKAIGFDEFLLRTELALRFINAEKFHTTERPCPPITLLRHLDSYAEQGRALGANNIQGKLSEADRKALERANHWYEAVAGARP